MEFNFDQPRALFQTVDGVARERVIDPEEADFNIYADADNPEDIKKSIDIALQQRYWWLCKGWQKQGKPKEQFEYGNIKIFNFFRPLTEQEKVEIESGLKFVSKIKSEVLHTIDYVLISGEDGANLQSGKKFLGFSRDEQRMIRLHPETFSQERERRIPEISNLELVVTHEPIHHVINKNKDILKDWYGRFGWMVNEDPNQFMGDGVTRKTYVTKYPERCVTDYAQVDADEDMCESFSALYAGIDRLDSEKAKFLQRNLFEDREHKNTLKTVPVSLPQVSKLKYFIKKPIKIGIKPKTS
jgi:hypothetical protein